MNLGQVYTKDLVASYMVGLLDLPKNAHVVDPCFGRGVFVKHLLKSGFTNITGVEIDPDTYNQINISEFQGVTLENKDFFCYSSPTIDAFVLNPPYVRQEEIDDMELLGVTKDSIVGKCGDFKIYSKANLYLYFIARCIALLPTNGQMVAIYPNAWLNTPDGRGFLDQIKSKGRINNLIQVKGYPFVGNPLVDVMIMKFTKDSKGDTKEETMVVTDNSLTLEPGQKELDIKSLNCIPLSSIAKVRRGITTGFNRIFVNPTISNPDYITSILSSPKDVEGYSTINARLDNLLVIPNKDIEDESIKQYLICSEELILKEGKPKTIVEQIKNGKNWYSLNVPNPSDIIFPYIIRDNVRFIANEGRVVARDNFYVISGECSMYLLIALLNNLFVFSQLELFGKSYGNGLLKIQKYDVDNIVIPNPLNIDDSTQTILENYAKNLIKTGDKDIILSITTLLEKYYNVENIQDIYHSQKNNRLKYES